MKNNIRCSRFQLSALAIVGFFFSLQAAAVDYTVTELDALGGTSSGAYSINNPYGAGNPYSNQELYVVPSDE